MYICSKRHSKLSTYHTVPRLNPEQIKQLEAPITTHDITKAISQLAKSKAPGLDGLEFYATYSDILIPS